MHPTLSCLTVLRRIGWATEMLMVIDWLIGALRGSVRVASWQHCQTIDTWYKLYRTTQRPKVAAVALQP